MIVIMLVTILMAMTMVPTTNQGWQVNHVGQLPMGFKSMPDPDSGDGIVNVTFMVDGGSNTNILKITPTQARCLGLRRVVGPDNTIAGFAVGSSVTVLGTVDVVAWFTDKANINLIEASFVPDARNSILSESYLINHGVEINKSKAGQTMVFPNGDRVRLHRTNGLYYCNVGLVRHRPRTVNAVRPKIEDLTLLWAARMQVDAKGLTKMSEAVRGIDIRDIPDQTAEIIDRDRFRRLQCSSKNPVGRTPIKDLAEKPGEVFICDGFGKHTAPSPIDGAVYQLLAVDEKSDFGYTKNVRTHTIDDWMSFLAEVALDARLNGHTPKIFRFDQAPELRSKTLENRVNRELQMQVELTPRSHHEGVGRVEGHNDILTRRAEASMQRAELGTAFLLPARSYSQEIINYKASGTNKESRYQVYYGKIPSIDKDRPPYLFGTQVMYHEEKEARGPKGSLPRPRANRGIIVGVTGKRGSSGNVAYMVLKRGGGLITPRHVDAIDEMQLLRRGFPTSATTAEAETQTPAMTEMLTQPLVKKREPASASKVDLPIGARIGVMWLPPGKGQQMVEYLGTVVEEIRRAGHSVMHKIHYDDYDEVLNHDFARTQRQWRVVSLPTDKNNKSGAGPSRVQTRAQSQPAANWTKCDNCALTPQVNKATQNIIDVRTDLGVQQFKVPANKREVAESPQSEEWLEAERAALDAILKAGNKLVPISVPADRGVPIARTVTARRLKLDPATGKLASKNAFKSRHNVDGGYLKVQRELMNQSDETNDDAQVPTTSTVVDDITLKMFLAYAARHDLEITTADVGNAYPKGVSNRPVGYMHLPSTLPETDEDGSPLCIELHTPMWGEQEAGYEWQCTLTKVLLRIGWMRCEGVPAAYTFTKPGMEVVVMVTIVDDFAIAEKGSAITDATIQELRKEFKDLSVQRDPSSFSGFKITRNRSTKSLTISMPQKIVEATRRYLPEAFEGAKKVDVLKGEKLMRVADGMTLDAEAQTTKRLNIKQKTTQMIIGSLKFIEKVMPELSLPLHRLSCIMSAPPDEALAVAKGVLYRAYTNMDHGITFGGINSDVTPTDENIGIEGKAPYYLTASADATWNDGRNIYGVMLMYNHGAILHMTKKIRPIVESSHHSEAIATCKAVEQVMYAREVLRALGEPQTRPTKIATDNRANLLVANDATSAKKAKFFLRQYHILQRRIDEGDIAVTKLPTNLMPADFLTKWLSGKKLKKSVEYATNSTIL